LSACYWSEYNYDLRNIALKRAGATKSARYQAFSPNYLDRGRYGAHLTSIAEGNPARQSQRKSGMFKTTLSTIAFGSTLAIAGLPPTNAMEFGRVSAEHNSAVIGVSGKIEDGDAAKFSSYLQTLPNNDPELGAGRAANLRARWGWRLKECCVAEARRHSPIALPRSSSSSGK
jgi:hypothetical protein